MISQSPKRRVTRPAASLGLAFLALGVSACGSSLSHRVSEKQALGASTSAQLMTHTTPLDGDGDEDGKPSVHYDVDDKAFLSVGEPSSFAERQAAADVVQLYFAAASDGEAVNGCGLLYVPYAEALVEEHLGPGASFDQQTCAGVLAGLFEIYRGVLSKDRFSWEMTGFRVEGDRGWALLRVRGLRHRHLQLHREHGKWKVAALLDNGRA